MCCRADLDGWQNKGVAWRTLSFGVWKKTTLVQWLQAGWFGVSLEKPCVGRGSVWLSGRGAPTQMSDPDTLCHHSDESASRRGSRSGSLSNYITNILRRAKMPAVATSARVRIIVIISPPLFGSGGTPILNSFS